MTDYLQRAQIAFYLSYIHKELNSNNTILVNSKRAAFCNYIAGSIIKRLDDLNANDLRSLISDYLSDINDGSKLMTHLYTYVHDPVITFYKTIKPI